MRMVSTLGSEMWFPGFKPLLSNATWTATHREAPAMAEVRAQARVHIQGTQGALPGDRVRRPGRAAGVRRPQTAETGRVVYSWLTA
jgi:hypothetical protein